MPDYTKMSDEELMKIAGVTPEQLAAPAAPAAPEVDYSAMSDEELMKIVTGGELEETSIGQSVLQGVADVGQFIDTYTGAPARAAIQEFKDVLTMPKGLATAPGVPQGFPQLTKAAVRGVAKFGSQFGEDPALAPTGKAIAADLGASTEETIGLPFTDTKLSPAGIAGFGIDVIADPTNIIPVAAPAKLLAKGSKAGSKAALKGSAAAADFLTSKAGLGTPIASATAVGKKLANSSKNTFESIFKPKQAADFPELVAIAEKNGINPSGLPESVEFGPSTLISRGARVERESIGGEEALDAFMSKLSEVQRATDNKIAEIGGGTILDAVDAGNLIRRDYDRAVGEFFDNVDVSYSSITKDYPGLKLSDAAMQNLESKLVGIEKFAKGRVRRGVTQLQRGQGQGLLNSVAAIRSTNGSVKQTVEALRDIGEAAFKSENTLAAMPADVAKMRGLYGDISQALKDTVKTEVQNGEAVAGALEINNKLMSDFFSDKNIVSKAIGNKSLSPEGVFRNLIAGGDTKKLEALRNILSPEAMQTIKASLLDSMIKRTDDGFSYRALTNSMRIKKTNLKALLSEDELAEFSELVRLGDRFGNVFMNTSGTEISRMFKDIPASILAKMTNEGFIEGLKVNARARTARQAASVGLEVPVPKGLNIPMRRGVKETLGLKVPQVISVQQRNQE